MSTAERLAEALEWREQFEPRDGEDSNERFERIAEVFRKETGYLRPGKDCRLHSPEERQAAWDAWMAAGRELCRLALAAYRSTPADGGGQGVTWRPPGPVTPEHPLKCLIVLPALRQSDGDWWACQKFFGDSEPLGWLPDTPEIRAAIGTPASTGGERKEPPLNGRCQADRDGDCVHSQCPQLRDGEPKATGRHCPLDTEDDDA